MSARPGAAGVRLAVTLAILTKCRTYFSDPTDPRLAVNRNAFAREEGKSYA